MKNATGFSLPARAFEWGLISFCEKEGKLMGGKVWIPSSTGGRIQGGFLWTNWNTVRALGAFRFVGEPGVVVS